MFDEIEEAARASRSALVLHLAAFVPFWFALLVAIFTFANGVDADLRYFELAAQIIPVLVLALVIEQRYFFQRLPYSMPTNPTGPWQTEWKRVIVKIYRYQAGVFLMLAGGEVAALWSVGSVDTSALTFAVTTAGLTASALAIAVSSAKGLIDSALERETVSELKRGHLPVLWRVYQRTEWKTLIESADEGVPESERAKLEGSMKEAAERMLQTDLDLTTEDFPEELDRLSQKEKQGNLTPGEKMALRVMRQIEP